MAMTLVGSTFVISVIVLLIGVAVVMAATHTTHKPSGVATPPNRVDGSEYVLYGVTLIDDGLQYYPDWRSSMLREFDEGIEPNLEDYFRMARAVARHPREKWRMLTEEHLATTEATRDDL